VARFEGRRKKKVSYLMKMIPRTTKPYKIAVYVGDMIDFLDKEAARDGAKRRKRPSRSRIIRAGLELLKAERDQHMGRG
jgi:hypothetical protein